MGWTQRLITLMLIGIKRFSSILALGLAATTIHIEEAKKHLLKCKWKLIEDRNSSCCFEKQSTHLYVHFLGFAVATGPDVSTDEVIANCGTKWLGNTSLPGREVKKQKIDGNNWEEEVAQAAAVLALEQLKDWATAPSFEGQVNSADRLFLQLQRIHELFPPNDKKSRGNI